jgi:uncharacterized protein (TIGR02147 family)
MPFPNPFHYSDYRALLREALEWSKQNGPGLSQRRIAQELGVANSFIPKVLAGDLIPTDERMAQIAALLEWNSKELDYVIWLLRWTRESDPKLRASIAEAIRKLRTANFRDLDSQDFGFFRRWYIPVLRELMTQADVADWSPLKIAQSIRPELTPDEVLSGLHFLVRNGYLTETEDGYIRSEPIIRGRDPSSKIMTEYVQTSMELARRALIEDPRDQRSLSATVLSLSAEGLQKLHSRIEEFRQDLLLLAQEDSNADSVVQVNLQMFAVVPSSPKEES